MSRVKVSIVAVLVVSALSALAASSASAGWMIGGKELAKGATAALSNTAAVDEDATLRIVVSPTVTVKIKCVGTTLDGEKPEIVGGNEGKANSLIFTGCATVEPTKCALEESTVRTAPVVGTATLGPGESVIFAFKPQTKSEFAKLKFSSVNSCAFNEEESVKGLVKINAPTGQLELLSQAIQGLGSLEGNNSLEVAGDKSFIEGGKALLHLASDEKWSFL